MKTKVTLTIEHPDDAPIHWFMEYTLQQYIREVNADVEDGWHITIGDSDE